MEESLVIEIGIIWTAVLAAALATAAARGPDVLARILWIDTLAVILIAFFAFLAYQRSAAGYLDAALALALLAFAGAIAAIRYTSRRPS